MNRIYKWDNLKFLLILLVVVGHFVDGFVDISNTYKFIFLYIYIFHMPLFIFISGLFQKEYNEEHSLEKNKVIFYLMLGFFLKILIYTTNYAFNGKATFNLLSDSGTPWFMFALPVFMIMTCIFRNTNLKILFLFSILLACFTGYDKTIGDYLYLSRIIVFYPFYLLGYMLDKNKVTNYLENNKLKLISFFIVLGSLLIIANNLELFYSLRRMFTGRNSYNQYIIDHGGCLVRLFCYFMTFIIGIAVSSLIPNHKLKNITEFGQRTLAVYFYHRIILYVLVYIGIPELLQSIFGIYIWKIVYLISAILLTIVLSTKCFANSLIYLEKKLNR